MSTVFDQLEMVGDEREALELLAQRPRSIATLSERLGLSGSIDEHAALVVALQHLRRRGYIARCYEPGWATERYEATDEGREAVRKGRGPR